MTKWIGVLIFLFFFSNAHAQTDSAALQSAASDLLQREVSFTFSGGKLTEAFQQLSKKQLKFSYSDDRIAPVSVATITVSDTPLFALMDLLLQNTKFTYLVVGRIILIVEDETLHETDSTEKPRASPVIIKPESHIYTPHSSEVEMSPKLKRTLDKLYHDELRWAASRTKNTSSAGDTVVSPEQSIAWDGYFLSGGLGINAYKLRTQTNT